MASLVGLFILSGCAGAPPITSVNGLEVVRSGDLPAPARADLVASDRPSLVGPLDKLEISVFDVPGMDTEALVDASGRISVPLIGAVDVRGLTPQEISDAISSRLSRFVRDPYVTVNVLESTSQAVTVDGEVETPGLYPVTNQMTLMRAIASAEGLTEYAKLEQVIVLRTANGQRMAGVYDLGAIRRGAYEDPAIYANDVVLVGDSPMRRRFQDILAVAPLLTAPLIILFQNN
ncbi:polysaccharide biosynthesis/export family protein [Qipengyuania spongiae]|uniref:Polysaccharide export protein n=1 Tax=Qipengyuania spongiae TaxID=2909673 RepID=A0ABY5T216_9SPHN|nr:polysaccharide biosynthesis/export family protein [Qipengyuania spongiae]UVI40845.1 polysaccharide export protein [Qipengyuania spongiae]